MISGIRVQTIDAGCIVIARHAIASFVRCLSLILLTLAGACTDSAVTNRGSLNASIGSPCGFGGGVATAGAGFGGGTLVGIGEGVISCAGAGPFAPLCLAAVVVVGASVGLVYGIADAVANAPSCDNEMEVDNAAFEMGTPSGDFPTDDAASSAGTAGDAAAGDSQPGDASVNSPDEFFARLSVSSVRTGGSNESESGVSGMRRK